MVVQVWWLRLRWFESRVTLARPTEYKKFLCNIKGLISLCTKAFNITDITVNRMSGSPNDGFNKEKFKQVLHYIIASCGHIENVGKTVLFKLPYFSDFNYYELYEEKLTGESYTHIPHGPAPRHFDEIILELMSECKISHFKTMYYGREQNKYVSLIEPTTDLLNQKELGVINDVLDKCSKMNATEISDLSHMDMPYKATKPGCEIDYDLVFYRDALTSVRNYDEND